MFVPVKIIIDKVLRHPLLKDLDEEYILDYIVEFIGLIGAPELYEEQCGVFKAFEHRILLPDTLVSLKGVRDHISKRAYIPSSNTYNDRSNSLTYKLQGNVLFLGNPEALVEVLYNIIPVDEEGQPKISDDPTFLRALEAYIKQQAFTVLFDLGKIHPSVLNNAQTDYCWAVKNYTAKRKIPSIDQMESIKNIIRGISQYHHATNFSKLNLE